MKRNRSLGLALVTGMLALVLAGCGDSGADGSVASTAPPATAAPTTAASTTTPATTPATVAPATSAAPATTEPMDDGTPSDMASSIEILGLEEAFSLRTFEMTAGEPFTIIFNNKDTSGEPHNMHVRTPSNDWFTTIAEAPDIQELTFTIDEAGEYSFFCDTHPDTMKGTIVIIEDM